MEEKILVQLKVFIPKFNEFPLAEAWKWAENYYAQTRHITGQRRKALPTHQDVQEKAFDPLLKAYPQFLSPDFRSKSGLTAEHIREKLQRKLQDKETARRYLKEFEKAYRTENGIRAKRIKEDLPGNAAKYACQMTFGNWRFLGPINQQGRGAIPLVLDWLSGETDALNDLRPPDELISGQPVLITTPGRTGRFRKQLQNALLKSARFISESNYHPTATREENDKVNQLVNEFGRSGIVPFSPSGASHLDFVPHPETAEWCLSRRFRLIQHKIWTHFCGNISPEPVVLPEELKITNPADFIGDPMHPLYLEMHLDIQVSLCW